MSEYVWFGDIPVAVLIPDPASPANPKVFYIHTDHLDTPRVIVDTQGRPRWRWMSEPFGTAPAETAPTAGLEPLDVLLRLPGQQFDRVFGLHYNYFRDYDPSIGRYVQSDPVGLEGGISTYAYVGSRPTAYADPKGLSPYETPFGPLIPPDPFSSATAPNACPPDDCPHPVTVTFTTGNVCASGDSFCIQAMRAAGLQGPYTPQTRTATYSGNCLLKFGVGFAGGKFAVGTVLINKAPNIATGIGLGAANVARVTKVAARMKSPPAIAVSVSVAVFGVLKECACGKK